MSAAADPASAGGPVSAASAAGVDAVAMLEVLDGGLLTTVQDGGRPDWAHLGVPESGAADPWSLAVSNLLVGNGPAAAALELTIVGGSFAVLCDVTIGLAGADLGARVRGGPRLDAGRTHRLTAGAVLDMPGDGPAADGARAYLALPGGIAVGPVLGSRSTCLPGAFGGLDGRTLRTGDSITAAARAQNLVRGDRAWPGEARPREAWPGASGAAATPVLHFLATDRAAGAALADGAWRVAAAADRVGIRLDGEPLADDLRGEALTHGVVWGTIQVPPDGRPIILGPDHQTTGGYRVAGVVITADRRVLGQLRPGSAVRLVATDRAAALAELRALQEGLAWGAAALREAARWDALAESAGG